MFFRLHKGPPPPLFLNFGCFSLVAAIGGTGSERTSERRCCWPELADKVQAEGVRNFLLRFGEKNHLIWGEMEGGRGVPEFQTPQKLVNNCYLQ